MARVAFLFPGQGAQSVGMAKGLCDALPAARRLFDQAAAILGYDLLGVCTNGPAERLNATAVSQPAIYVASLAALEKARESEAQALSDCVCCAGLSLGEYTALTFAGVLSFQEGLRLVQKRGAAMQTASDAVPSGMLSVLLLEPAKVEEIVARARALGPSVRIANFLCPGNLAVSGEKAAIDEVDRLAQEAGAKTVRLAVAGAFHTALMQPAVAELAPALANVKLGEMRVPVWANVTGKPCGVAEVRDLLARQVVEPVRWEETMRGMLEAGVEKFCEVGPGSVLRGLLKRIQRKAECTSIQA
jgi:[acyl-carrier-protein] S-malonyltransferase